MVPANLFGFAQVKRTRLETCGYKRCATVYVDDSGADSNSQLRFLRPNVWTFGQTPRKVLNKACGISNGEFWQFWGYLRFGRWASNSRPRHSSSSFNPCQAVSYGATQVKQKTYLADWDCNQQSPRAKTLPWNCWHSCFVFESSKYGHRAELW